VRLEAARHPRSRGRPPELRHAQGTHPPFRRRDRASYPHEEAEPGRGDRSASRGDSARQPRGQRLLHRGPGESARLGAAGGSRREKAREARTAARRAGGDQGPHRDRRHPDDLRLDAVSRPRSHRGRRGGAQAQGRGRDRARQDQHSRVRRRREHGQQGVRRDAQPLEHGALGLGLDRRRSGGARGAHDPARRRHRFRRGSAASSDCAPRRAW